jgi:hypothetical protein
MRRGCRESLSRLAVSGLTLKIVANQADVSRGHLKAIAFDGFTILDPRAVFAVLN